MTDVLIRNVPDDDLRRIDEKARRLGLSRSEFLKRQIAQEAARDSSDDGATVDVFSRLADLAVDLASDEVMDDAWA